MVLTQFWRLLAASWVWKCDSNPPSSTYISQIPLSHLGSQTNPPISSFCGLLRHNLCFPWKRRTAQPKVFMTHLNNGKMQGETKWQIEICQCSSDHQINWDDTVHKENVAHGESIPHISLSPEGDRQERCAEWVMELYRPPPPLHHLLAVNHVINWTILYCFGVTKNWAQLMTNRFCERKLQ